MRKGDGWEIEPEILHPVKIWTEANKARPGRREEERRGQGNSRCEDLQVRELNERKAVLGGRGSGC